MVDEQWDMFMAHPEIPPDLGGWPDMEWDQAALGCGLERVWHQHLILFSSYILHFLTSRYVSDMWNVVDFITNSLYVATIGLRLRAYYDVSSFSGSTWVLWCTITTFMPAHLLLGKSGGRNEGPTFQRPHRHHISNAFRLIFQKTYNSKVPVSKNVDQNIKVMVGICKNYLFILCEDWERRFVSRQWQRQMLGDKMTNPGLSCDKSRRLSGLDIARSAAGSPFLGAE